jgi:transcriptional regulator GlxA family with amidase domain
MHTSHSICRKEPRIQWVINELSCSDLREPVSLQRLASKVNLSLSRLRHVFAQSTGVSLARYLKKMRLVRAQYLLEHSLLTVKEVAAAAGFNDASHFVRDYKAAYGESPSESRNRVLPAILFGERLK